MTTKRLFISLVSLFNLALVACSTQYTTEINADGSGEFNVRFTLTDEDIKAIEEEEGDDFEDLLFDESGEDDFETLCEDMVTSEEVESGVSARYSERRGDISCEISTPFEDLDELIEIYKDMFPGMTGVVRMNTEGELEYAIELDMFDYVSEDWIGVGETDNLWTVIAPGSIENNNADEQQGQMLTWELNSQDSESIEFDSSPRGFFSVLTGDISFPWWILAFAFLCLCGVAFVVIGGVTFYVYTKNKKNAEKT